MRLSPVFVAVFGLTATVGLSNSANGQTSPACFTRSQETLGTLYDLNLDWLLSQSTTEADFSPVSGFNETEGEIVFCEHNYFSSFDSTLQSFLAFSLNKAEITKSGSLFVGQRISEDIVLNKIKPSYPSLFSVAFHQSDTFQSKLFSWDLKELERVKFDSVFIPLSRSEELALNKWEEVKPELVQPSEELALSKSKPEELSQELALNKLEEIKPELVQPSEELALTKSKAEELSQELALNKLEEIKPELVQPSEELALSKSKPEPIINREISLYKIEAEQSEPVLFESKIEAVANSTQSQSSQLGEPLYQQPFELAQIPPEGELEPEIEPEVELEIEPESEPEIELENNNIPQPPPPVPPPPTPRPTPSQNAQPEPQVLVAEVVVEGTDSEVLIERVYDVISTVPGQTTTRSQLQQDINAIFALGFFRNVRATPQDTPLGVRVTFEVEPNPPLEAIIIEGDSVLPPEVVEESFEGQFNEIINLNEIEEAIQEINSWYQENGYVLAQVIEAPEIGPDGTVTLVVAEGEIEDIRVRFLSSEGDETDEEGNPIDGRTQDYIILREIELEPGDVFNQRIAQQDLSRVFGLGIFEDVRLQLEPADEDPRKAVMVVNVVERSTGSLVLGGGVSSATGLFGTVSYQELNINGRNQRLGAEVQLGERIVLLDISFTDPWIGGDPYRTSYTANIFRRQAISVIFEQDDEDDNVRLPNGDRPRVVRTGGGITFTRPFAEDVFSEPNWVASLGVQYQRVEIRDADGDITPRDDAGKLLSESDEGEDDLFTLQFGVARDRRNNPQFPTSGYAFRFGTEQAIPIGSGNISYNRLRATYSFYLPVSFLQLVPDAPQTIAFNFQAGTLIGDFPPYEAFALGGANTVRGWREGHLAAARSFVLGSIEYRFPVFAVSNFLIGGAVFIDGASALGTQSTVPGNPGGIRGKPGSGLGVGAGLRIQSPLGPIRIDYGVNDEGDGRIHFGVGERF